jgi:hypothetical protein
MMSRKLPIGIQDFEKLRSEGYIYADKTAYIHQLIQESTPYFLGRPRRFGKSLLVSTIRAFFEGKKELFRGLAIERLEKDWTPSPVFHIDFNLTSYKDTKTLEQGIDANLKPLERQWGRSSPSVPDSIRFYELIRNAAEKSGMRVVVLIDEYDRPLIQTMDKLAVQDEIRVSLKSFYGVLKSADRWLRFVLLTGVTKFSQVSVFSDLNQLRDISMGGQYADICGITEDELVHTFTPELQALAEAGHLSFEGVLNELRRIYNGYRFSEDSEEVYNPFSLLNAMKDKKFNYYWFRTGTPTFLINQLKNTDFNIRQYSDGISVFSQALSDYRVDGGNPIPLLYQSGYLTIKSYDERLRKYTLGFPNEEVALGFMEELAVSYAAPEDDKGFFIGKFLDDIENGDIDSFMTRIKSFIANMPYGRRGKDEQVIQNAFYMIFTLMGRLTRAEVRSFKGRADCVVESRDRVYLFEFKLIEDESQSKTGTALRQIEESGYAEPYFMGAKKIVKIGVEYNISKRIMGEWEVRSD